MNSLLTPSVQQLEDQLDSLLEHQDEARVVGLHSPTRRPWGEVIERGGRRFHIAWCESELEIREALADLEQTPDKRLLVLTPLDNAQLGADIAARLPRAELASVSRWSALRLAFRAREIDPRLREHRWLCQLLLERAPAEGYPPVPGGVLDLDSAWRHCLVQVLGLPEARADASALLTWTLEGGNLQRFETLAGGDREQLLARMGAEGGRAVELVTGAIDAGKGPDALAVGLACSVVFSDGEKTAALGEAAVRLESYLGSKKIDPAAGAALAEAARSVLRTLVADDKSKAQEAEARAEAILKAVDASDHADRSPVLTSGMEMHLADAARAAVAAASGDQREAARAAEAVRSAKQHDRADHHQARLDRALMAVRLSRWLSEIRQAPTSFAGAARDYAVNGGYVDWARQQLQAGDGVPQIASAYAEIGRLAQARRDEENRIFAELLVEWNRTRADVEGALPVERFLDAILAPLANDHLVLLLVLDGLSFAVARPLLADRGLTGWDELTPEKHAAPPLLVAALPSVTEVSRASLLSGKLMRGDSKAERTAFAAHAKLKEVSRAATPPILFHKADLGAGPELDERVRSALADRGQQVVGVVHNAVDAQLSGSDQIDLAWSSEILRQLTALLRMARESRRLVIVTGDHGHMLEAGTTLVMGDAGDRWRSGGSAGEGEVEAHGSCLPLSADAETTVLAWSEGIRYAGKRSGYHGGASPQEVLIPLAVLGRGLTPKDWDQAPPAEPPWWVGQGGHQSDPPQNLTAATGPRAGSRQADLFEQPPPPTDWIELLLRSPNYAAQNALAARGAPDDWQLSNLLSALAARAGRRSRTALAQELGLPAYRVSRLVNAAKRVLNLDQAPVLLLDAASDEVFLDIALLRSQFELGDLP